jgi:hypothetical protein
MRENHKHPYIGIADTLKKLVKPGWHANTPGLILKNFDRIRKEFDDEKKFGNEEEVRRRRSSIATSRRTTKTKLPQNKNLNPLLTPIIVHKVNSILQTHKPTASSAMPFKPSFPSHLVLITYLFLKHTCIHIRMHVCSIIENE